MKNWLETIEVLITGIGLFYFLLAGVILICVGGPYYLCREHFRSASIRNALASMVFSLAFAPSIFGYDMGEATLPAVFVALLGVFGKVRPVAVWWSLISIVLTFFLIHLIKAFVVKLPRREDTKK